MTVVGPATGTRYQFSEFRRRLTVDPMDAAGVARAPELVRVSAP